MHWPHSIPCAGLVPEGVDFSLQITTYLLQLIIFTHQTCASWWNEKRKREWDCGREGEEEGEEGRERDEREGSKGEGQCKEDIEQAITTCAGQGQLVPDGEEQCREKRERKELYMHIGSNSVIVRSSTIIVVLA